MMVSPASNLCASALTVCSVGSPAGTMIQAARGLASLATKSSSEADPVAPSLASSATFCGLRSETTHWWPPRISRRTMLPPIRPRPIIPNCMLPSSWENLGNLGLLSENSDPAKRERNPYRYLRCMGEYMDPSPLVRDCGRKPLQALGHVFPQVHPQCASLALRQNLKIATR